MTQTLSVVITDVTPLRRTGNSRKQVTHVYNQDRYDITVPIMLCKMQMEMQIQ